MNKTRREFLKGAAVATTALAMPSILKAETPAPLRRTIESWSTGFPKLDEALGGGFIRGRYYLVLGRPGTGKTHLLKRWGNDQSPDSNYYRGYHHFIFDESDPDDNRLIMLDDDGMSPWFMSYHGSHLSSYAREKESAIVQGLQVNRSGSITPMSFQPPDCGDHHPLMYAAHTVLRLDNSEQGRLYVDILKNRDGPLGRVLIYEILKNR